MKTTIMALILLGVFIGQASSYNVILPSGDWLTAFDSELLENGTLLLTMPDTTPDFCDEEPGIIFKLVPWDYTKST